jgi:hypothetical protein
VGIIIEKERISDSREQDALTTTKGIIIEKGSVSVSLTFCVKP